MFIVHLAGHLGKDPETRFTPSGQKVTTFTIATNQRKGKEDVTVWVRVTIWGDRFDKLLSFLKKGSGVIVIGRMMPPSSYTDKEGRTQISLEVTAEMIEFSPFGRTDRSGEGQGQNAAQGAGQGSYANSNATNYQENQYPAGGNSRSPSYGAQAGEGYAQGDEEPLPF